MKPLAIHHAGRSWRLSPAADLALPLDFHGLQPNAYGVPPATAVPYSGEGFILDTRQGGSCNCETLTLTPHCHGTHTECVGHITRQRGYIPSVLTLDFLAATLISVQPAGREITADAIEIVKYDPQFLEALIVRTLPNDDRKRTRRWDNDATPYFTPDAMTAIRALGVTHLLVDLPSLDPLADEGRLAAHRVFWAMPPGSRDVPKATALQTVTELIFVPDAIADGRYFLSIHIPHFLSDAAPSRPILYRIDEES
jgi:kynurenine formamidase